VELSSRRRCSIGQSLIRRIAKLSFKTECVTRFLYNGQEHYQESRCPWVIKQRLFIWMKVDVEGMDPCFGHGKVAKLFSIFDEVVEVTDERNAVEKLNSGEQLEGNDRDISREVDDVVIV